MHSPRLRGQPDGSYPVPAKAGTAPYQSRRVQPAGAPGGPETASALNGQALQMHAPRLRGQSDGSYPVPAEAGTVPYQSRRVQPAGGPGILHRCRWPLLLLTLLEALPDTAV